MARIEFDFDMISRFNKPCYVATLISPGPSPVWALCSRTTVAGRAGRYFYHATVKLNPKLYSQLLYDKRISAHAFRLWHLLRDRVGDNSCAWPGYLSIQKDLGCGSWRVNHCIKELVNAGYIKVKRGNQRRSNSYFLTATPVPARTTPSTARRTPNNDSRTTPGTAQNLPHEPNKRTEALKVDKETAEQMRTTYEQLGWRVPAFIPAKGAAQK